jgi:AraC-like DNA-binding protein
MYRFSTNDYQPGERFDAWRDELMNLVCGLDATLPLRARDRAFQGEWTGFTLGALEVTQFVTTDVVVQRKRNHLSDGRDHFIFCMPRSGLLEVEQNDESLASSDTRAIMATAAHPVSFSVTTHVSQPARFIGLLIPREVLTPVAPNATRMGLCAMGTAKTAIYLDYLSRYADVFARTGAPLDAALATSAGQHMLDLIVMMLDGAASERVDLANQRGLRAVRQRALIDDIRRHFATADFSCAALAKRHAISERYAQALLEEAGETFSRMVLRLRLERAAMLLRKPSSAQLRIDEIGYACGFNELSYFYRTFKREFGVSPRAYRTVAQRDI